MTRSGDKARQPDRPTRWGGWFAVLLCAALLAACDNSSPPAGKVPVAGREGAAKSAAVVRAQRRAFDGAPPVIPHQNFKIGCIACHNEQGTEVPPYGFAPPSPHEWTAGLSAVSRCRQCHVFKTTDETFVDNSFQGLAQDLRRGRRLNPLAPPVIPHLVLMRENCLACHSGPAAREEVRCTHPERLRCRQCHVQQVTDGRFTRADAPAP